MGSCFSRKESQKQIVKIKAKEYSDEIGWFDLPYEIRRLIIDLMDLQTRSQFAQCSEDCYEEIFESRNYIDLIEISYVIKNGIRYICILVEGKDQKWLFVIKESSRNAEVQWVMNDELVMKKTFENQNPIQVLLIYFDDFVKKNNRSLINIRIFINDFPYHKTSIRNFKNQKLEHLVLFNNKYGIDPILSGFIDLHTILNFQKTN
ncbi:unnamed protein product [Caenorhabditis angaria]|uniref:F-box domain-containing protein n=1 Tax=Caenorhabditis angaria TaxID=860376 RepID=A0A9P1IFX6_9PELO|nr:unnamed protein product [Caenorhabditis angaria]